MSINMEAMRAKYKALQNKGKGGSNKDMFWRPEDGGDYNSYYPDCRR